MLDIWRLDELRGITPRTGLVIGAHDLHRPASVPGCAGAPAGSAEAAATVGAAQIQPGHDRRQHRQRLARRDTLPILLATDARIVSAGRGASGGPSERLLDRLPDDRAGGRRAGAACRDPAAGGPGGALPQGRDAPRSPGHLQGGRGARVEAAVLGVWLGVRVAYGSMAAVPVRLGDVGRCSRARRSIPRWPSSRGQRSGLPSGPSTTSARRPTTAGLCGGRILVRALREAGGLNWRGSLGPLRPYLPDRCAARSLRFLRPYHPIRRTSRVPAGQRYVEQFTHPSAVRALTPARLVLGDHPACARAPAVSACIFFTVALPGGKRRTSSAIPSPSLQDPRKRQEPRWSTGRGMASQSRARATYLPCPRAPTRRPARSPARG